MPQEFSSVPCCEPIDTQRCALIAVGFQLRIVGLETAPRTGAEVVRQSMLLARAVRRRGGVVVVVAAERSGAEQQPPGSELVREMLPQPGDLLVFAPGPGAFHATGLHDDLCKYGITTLVFAGIATGTEIEETAREAAGLGYRLAFAEDALTGLDADTHAASVSSVLSPLGAVCATSDILTALT